MDENRDLYTKRGFFIVQTLTIARVLIAIIFAAVLLFSARSDSILIVCAVLLGLIEFTDLFDGYLARARGIVTEWGAMLDPYSDSISRIIVYWALARAELAIALIPLVMALRDVTVAYCRIILSRYGLSVSAKWGGKVKAIVQGSGAILLVLGPFYWELTGRWIVHLLSWIVIVVTAASVYGYARAAFSALRRGSENDLKENR